MKVFIPHKISIVNTPAVWKRTFPACWGRKLKAYIREEERDWCKPIALDESTERSRNFGAFMTSSGSINSGKIGLSFLLKCLSQYCGGWTHIQLLVETILQQHFKLFLGLNFWFHSLRIYSDIQIWGMMCLSGTAACVPEMAQLNLSPLSGPVGSSQPVSQFSTLPVHFFSKFSVHCSIGDCACSRERRGKQCLLVPIWELFAWMFSATIIVRFSHQKENTLTS